MTVRIGVVGCGKIAERHLNAYKKLKGLDIVITDVDETKQRVAERKNVEWCDDPDELVTNDQVDAIDVCTPVHTHEDIIVDAIETGKHVFCEKPLASSVEEGRRIQELAESTDQVVMVGYLYRFHPSFQFAKDILEEGIIGEPYNAIFRVGGRGSASAWKHKQGTNGGAGNEMLVHMLDLIHWYFGDITGAENLYTDVLLEEREIDGETVEADAEDFILLSMETDGCSNVVCQSDLVTPSYMNYVEIHGTNGSLWTTILDHFPAFVYCKEPRGIYDRGHNFKEFSHVDLFEKELDYFLNCIRDETLPNRNSPRETVAIRRVIDSVL